MVALNKTKLRREIEKARREAHKLRLVELRGLITAARQARREAVQKVRADCARARVEARLSCQQRAELAKERGAVVVVERLGKLADERELNKLHKASGPRVRSTSAERKQESDDEVRSNLPADMIRVFNATKKHIKGGPRKSRTEAFFQWAEENPDEVFGLLQHDADRYLAQLLAEQARTERQARGAAVPF